MLGEPDATGALSAAVLRAVALLAVSCHNLLAHVALAPGGNLAESSSTQWNQRDFSLLDYSACRLIILLLYFVVCFTPCSLSAAKVVPSRNLESSQRKGLVYVILTTHRLSLIMLCSRSDKCVALALSTCPRTPWCLHISPELTLSYYRCRVSS